MNMLSVCPPSPVQTQSTPIPSAPNELLFPASASDPHSYPLFAAIQREEEEIALKRGYGLVRNFRNFTQAQFEKKFGSDTPFIEVERRGHYFCSQCGPPKAGDGKFRVQIKFVDSLDAYIIDQALTCRSHVHSLKCEEVRPSSRDILDQQSLLSHDEVQYAMELGALSLPTHKVREAMRIRFPGPDYEGRLLGRLKTKGYEARFGNDPDSISRLMEFGNSIRSECGKFEFRIGSDMRLTDLIIVHKSMLPYVAEFGDFVINDGTYGCDVYGMLAMINTLVDSMGKSVMAGYSHFRSKDPEHLIRALQIIGLDRPGVLIPTKGTLILLLLNPLGRHIFYVSNIIRDRSCQHVLVCGVIWVKVSSKT